MPNQCYSSHFYALYSLRQLVRKSGIDSLRLRGHVSREALRMKDQEERRKYSQAPAIVAIPAEMPGRPTNELS